LPPQQPPTTQQQQQRQADQAGEGFDEEKAKKKSMSVTSTLQSMERFNQMDKQQQQQQPQDYYKPSQHQTPSMIAPPGTQQMMGSFFESPLLGNTLMNDYTRQLSPPQTHHHLSLGGGPMGQQGSTGEDGQKVKKSTATAVSNLMQAERQTQKRKDEAAPPPPPPPSTRLFAPLSNEQQQQQQQQPVRTQGALLGSNLIRPSRVSTNEDGFFDMGAFGGDYGYTFSPGEVVRTLGGNGAITESPMTQNMRMSFGYPGQYAAMAPPPQAMASTSNWPQQYQQRPPPQHFGPSSHLSLDGPSRTGKGERKRQAPTRQHQSSEDDDYDEDDKPSKKKSKKNKNTQEDPDEPRITSKHRGVCWYKRTKKWVVQTKVNGKRVHVGYFDDEEKAAEAYKNAVQGIQVRKALEAKQKALQQQQQLTNAMGGVDQAGNEPLQPVQQLTM
jgi:hypothetical protein